MQYLVLWSGNIRGARKTQIDSERAHLVGHWVDGWPMTFDSKQFGNALAPQHRRAWDEGRAQAWLTGNKPDSPWAVHIYGTRCNRLATYYCQPIVP
jgi:hypothetical protein